MCICVVTARKRSLRRLCFYRCLSVHRGGVHGCSGGACMVALGGCAWLLRGRGHARLLPGVACVVALGGCAWLLWGGMHGCSRGACMVAPGGGAWFFRWDTVNERPVRILLECILVSECELYGNKSIKLVSQFWKISKNIPYMYRWQF